jgi:hypothetical protein
MDRLGMDRPVVSRWGDLRWTGLVWMFLLALGFGCLERSHAQQVRVFAQDLNGFNQAAGNPPIVVDFENIPPNTDISDTIIDTIIGSIHFIRVQAPLIVVRGMDTYTPPGFTGVRDPNTNRLYPTTGENVLSPGGVVLAPGPNPQVEGDSLILQFNPPVQAFGFDLLSQSADGISFVTIRIRAADGSILYDGGIPISLIGGGCCGNPGGADFWGIVANEPIIARVEITEFDNNAIYPDSNVGYDTFRIALRVDSNRAGDVWMTGGGMVLTGSGQRVTHGFELHCNPTHEANQLQINWGNERFHLESVSEIQCSGTSDRGGFNAIQGRGTGRYQLGNGSWETALVEFSFTDVGEPGSLRDRVRLKVTVVRGAVMVDVLDVSGVLERGNYQVHTRDR